MDIRLILSYFRKNVRIILLIPFISGITSLLFSVFFIDKVYETESTMYIINKSTYGDTVISQQLVRDFREIIISRAVIDEVIKLPGLEYFNYKEISEKIRVNLKSDTRLIEIIARDKNPNHAADIANKISEVFVKKAFEMTELDNVKILYNADIPTKPVSPRLSVNFAAAILMGAVISILIALVKEIMDDTIRSEEELKNICQSKVFATVPYSREKKCKGKPMDIILWNKDKTNQKPSNINIVEEEAFKYIMADLRFSTKAASPTASPTALPAASPAASPTASPTASPAASPLLLSSISGNAADNIPCDLLSSALGGLPRSIAVVSWNDDAIRTYVALNLAAVMAISGLKVLYVDSDFRKPDIEKHIKNFDSPGLSGFLTGRSNFNEILKNTQLENLSYIYCGPCPLEPITVIEPGITRLLSEAYAQLYDLVIIDTPLISIYADSIIIAAITEGIIPVVIENGTKRSDFNIMHLRLKNLKSQIAGIVIVKETSKRRK